MPDKPSTKIVASTGTGALVTPLIVWAWNTHFPDNTMPGEVSGTLGALLGGIFAYVSALWLPKPE